MGDIYWDCSYTRRNCEGDNDDLSDTVGTQTVEDYFWAMGAQGPQPESFECREGLSYMTVGDFLELCGALIDSETADDESSGWCEGLIDTENRIYLNQLFIEKKLTEIQIEIIKMFYGLTDDDSGARWFDEIAFELSIDATEAYELYRRAMSKLRRDDQSLHQA